MFRSYKEVIRAPVQKKEDLIENVFSCNICDDGGWTSETEVVLHEKVWHKREMSEIVKGSSVKNPVCLVCLKKQDNLESLHQHYREVHLFSSPRAKRVEREIFVCNHCHQIFFNKAVLELHIIHKHTEKKETNELPKFHCPLCKKQMYNRSLKTHLITHNMRSVTCCPICLSKCISRKQMLEHVNETHRKHLLCNVCGYKASREENFHQHLSMCETKPMEGGIQYDMYFVIPQSKNAWKHPSCGLRGLELYNNVHICILCRHICYTKSQAIKHIYADHNYVRPTVKKMHKCACGEEFINGVHLKHHLFKNKGKEQEHYDPTIVNVSYTHLSFGLYLENEFTNRVDRLMETDFFTDGQLLADIMLAVLEPKRWKEARGDR